ncbi:hypothetical protein Pcinc_010333 [Petrolisthes cinctipes]|uniref:GIY-YIG domain-containing protein n=1 Tax=Petrolisthes cinctipes TaxID=88211 RepID=A0AAE1G303_PETCI|nr:hypothetical protein Pcinc_010333 [Petrolisthes cinctipes]
MRSSLVYKFRCPLCGFSYIGSTIRNLSVRVCEHGGRSCSTAVVSPLSTPTQSNIRDHPCLKLMMDLNIRNVLNKAR